MNISYLNTTLVIFKTHITISTFDTKVKYTIVKYTQ